MIFLEDNTWEVRETAKKGKGLFATTSIPPGKVIGDYTGKVIHPMDADEYERGKHFYLMYYHDTAGIFPDLSKSDLYLINHSCTPNCWIYTYKGHTLFFALRHIFPGEELTISYLLSPQDGFCKPCNHRCSCESEFCTKSMHLSETRYKFWQKAYKEISKQTKRERVYKGKPLPLLDEYPDSIPDHPAYTLFGNTHEKAKIMTDQTLPAKETVRQLIRDSGLTISFLNLGIHVIGVKNDEVITKPFKQQTVQSSRSLAKDNMQTP